MNGRLSVGNKTSFNNLCAEFFSHWQSGALDIVCCAAHFNDVYELFTLWLSEDYAADISADEFLTYAEAHFDVRTVSMRYPVIESMLKEHCVVVIRKFPTGPLDKVLTDRPLTDDDIARLCRNFKYHLVKLFLIKFHRGL